MSTKGSKGPVAIAPAATVTSDPEGAQSNSRDVAVRLHYLKDDPFYDTTKPLQIVPEWKDVKEQTNVMLEPGPMEILHDIRGHQHNFSLDEHGFKYVNAPTSFKAWTSQPEIGKAYLPELEDLLRKEVDGADEILFYDARLRQDTETGVKISGLSAKPFARQVHTDNTESSVISKIHNLTDLKAEYYLQGRVRIINIWRPIKHPVYDCGLAVANGAKLEKNDVIECDRRRADTGQFWDTMGVIKYREGFEWHYMSQQDEPDVLLFKNYDSATNIKSRWCLHTAFDLPPEEIPPNAPTRESIEVRALVFTLPHGLRRPSTIGVMQHPLAQQLEKEQLPLVNLSHCITDHPRKDIDEAAEVEDAMLLLRRNEVKRVQEINDQLRAELASAKATINHLNSDLTAANAQIGIQKDHMSGMQRQIEALEYQINRNGSNTSNIELTGLLKWISAQSREIEKWKAEAMGRGNQAVSKVWQGSVDEAVRREREKDAVVIKSKDNEIARLKEELSRMRVSR